MRATIEPQKKYWVYQSYPEEYTYLFDTQDEAYKCAEEAGAFESCHGKEDWCEKYDESIFEICASELEDYAPVVFNTLEKSA